MHLRFQLLIAAKDLVFSVSEVVHVAGILDLLLHFLLGGWRFDLTLSHALDPIFLHSVHILHIKVTSGSVLLVGVKGAHVGIPIGVPDHTRAVHLIILELALVNRSILESDLA